MVNEDATGLDVIDNGNAKLIPYASFETVTSNNGIVLKVCKDVDGAITPLTSSELSAFTDYIKKIRFVGAPVVIRSVPADLLTPKIRVVYNESLVSAEDALANIKEVVVKHTPKYIGANAFANADARSEERRELEGWEYKI